MADALQGIGAVVSTQLLSRAATFLLNVLIARFANPTDYGIGYISFQLFGNLSLFMAKEGFRKVAQRVPEGSSVADHGLSSTNLGWGGALSSAVASPLLALYWCSYAPAAAPPSYFAAVALMASASVLEAVGEPFVIRALVAQDFRGRALGEGAALLARTVAMLLLTMAFGDLVLAFALSQLLYSAIWVAWFWRLATGKAGPPARLSSGEYVQPGHRALLAEFGGMAALKLLLTEGEKMLLLSLFSESDWGVFGLVSNFGSIVLRLLFAPVEEIAYSAFSAGGSKNDQRGLLRALLLLQGGVGWLGLCFGPGVSELVVRVVYGTTWAESEAPALLGAYCVLLFFMALNGILEGYMYSKCSPEWVRFCSFCQGGISLALALIAWLGQGYGPVALVCANCTSMLLRVVLCVAFVKRHLAMGWADFLDMSALKLFALLALSGAACSFVVPPVTTSIPWLAVARAFACMAACISVSVGLCRHELRATIREIRRRNVD